MNELKIPLLSSAYLGPIQYYAKIISARKVLLEKYENYQKQSYRNRCIILGANGPLVLSIPVAGGPGAKDPIQDLRLSYGQNWQQLHWRGIVSAYRNSPFFDYYADDLAPFYHTRRWKYLLDFNSEIQNVILQLINIRTEIIFTDSYIKARETPSEIQDFRYSIHPKPQRRFTDHEFTAVPYIQVFNNKFPFIPNLSIVDLLFNEGSSTLSLLQSCINQDPQT